MDRLGTTAPENDPALERALADALERRGRGIGSLERRAGTAMSLLVLSVVAALPLVLPSSRHLDAGLALGMVAAFAIADRVAFRVGAGWAVPTQLVLVPMLFLLPPAWVPALVTVAIALDRTPEFLSGEIHRSRLLLMLGNGWFAVGPAVVLALAGAPDPAWSDWPLYLGALGAQLAISTVQIAFDVTFVQRVPLETMLKEAGWVTLVDLLLSPVGLAVAFASAGEPWTFLIVLPLLGLLRVFAAEREARIQNALALTTAYRGTAHLMAELLTASHEYTGRHSRSVVVLSHQVAERLGLSEREVREVELGALLHDIGKLSVPNAIINKPGELTEEEWELMRAHTSEGQRMLSQIGGLLGEVGRVVRSHHENFDGSGYPDGLAGEEIPIAARVISACDAFNAMTTDRSYKPAMTVSEAIEELERCAGTQFDPRVVEAVVEIVRDWEPEPSVRPESLMPVFGRERAQAGAASAAGSAALRLQPPRAR